MTREHKLALIVGFSLILIVGVLISDHFSPARTQDVSAGAMSAGTPVKFGSSSDGLRIPAEPTLQTHLPDALASNNTPTQLREQPTYQPPVSPSPTSLPNNLTSKTTNELPGSGAPTELVMGGNGQASSPSPAIPEALRETFEPASGHIGERFAKGSAQLGSAMLPPPVSPESVLSKPVDQPAPILTPTKPYSSGSVKRYTIQEGDSIYRIAVDQYGDGSLWSRLRAFNPGKIGTDGEMRDGVVIELPPKDVLLGKAILPPPGAKPTPGTRPQAPSKIDSPLKRDGNSGGHAVYIVERGDDLGTVAKKKLGSAKRWREIAALNKDVLPDPDSLTTGMSLKIPAR